MTTSWGWLGSSFIVIALAAFTGSFLAAVPPFNHTFVPPLGMSAGQAVRLLADGICLLMIWRLATRAKGALHDSSKGSPFMRAIVLPAALLLIVIGTQQAYEAHWVPVLGSPRLPLYHWIMASLLIGSAMWLTVAGARHAGALRRTLVRTPRKRDGHATARQTSTSGTALATSSPPQDEGVPTTLGRYQIVRELGRGSMGVVYLGKDPRLQRLVAMKTLRFRDFDEAEAAQQSRERFFREAGITGRLSHPHIITIYDADEQNGLGYIAMEYLEGTLLSYHCRKPTLLPAVQVLQIMADVADALDYAHGRDVVHRDIKPDNIMLAKPQLVKVMDFGIAKTPGNPATHAPMMLGTPRYMSSEQVVGQEVDHRSDIFSLGVILFELLTGEKPFEADHMAALVARITKAAHPPLLKYRRDLPPRAQSIVDRALQKDTQNRYRHAGDMAADLREVAKALAR